MSVAVAGGLFLALEVLLRVAAPQVASTENVGGFARAIPDSGLGHRYRPGAVAIHRTPEFTARYEIGSDGRRVTGTPAADTAAVRVLVLGDSFTFGAGNESDRVWTAVMENSLRERGLNVEVWNAGVEGYDTRSELLLLQRLAPVVRPHVVVVGFLANDVYTNTPADAPAPSSAREHRGRRLELHTVELGKRLLMKNDRAYARLFLLTSRKEYYAASPSPLVSRQIGVTGDLLGALRGYCEQHGIAFAVVSMPQQFAVLSLGRGLSFPGIDPTVIDANLARIAAETGFPWIDVLPVLAADYREHGEDLYYRLDGHFTARGNRLVGEAAAAALAELVMAANAGP